MKRSYIIPVFMVSYWLVLFWASNAYTNPIYTTIEEPEGVCLEHCEKVVETHFEPHTVTYTVERLITHTEEHHEHFDFSYVTRKPRKPWPGHCYFNIPSGSQITEGIATKVGELTNGYDIYYTTDIALCRLYNPRKNNRGYYSRGHISYDKYWTISTTIAEYFTTTDTYYTLDTYEYWVCDTWCPCDPNPPDNPSPPNNPVPEPGTMLLFFTGLTTLVATKKYKG